jgi:hypothetical protein
VFYFLSQVPSARPGIHSTGLWTASASPASASASGIPRAAARGRPHGDRAAGGPAGARLHELGHAAAVGCPGQRRFGRRRFVGCHPGDFPISKHPARVVVQHATQRHVSSAADRWTAAFPAHLWNVSFSLFTPRSPIIGQCPLSWTTYISLGK